MEPPNLLQLGTAAVIIILVLDRFIDFASLFQTNDKNNGNARKRCHYNEVDRQKLDQVHIQVDKMHRRLEVNQELQQLLAAINNTLEGNTDILKKVANLLDNMSHKDQRTWDK